MEYTSLGTFEIESRGTVFVVLNDRKSHYTRLVGEEVIIDGKKYLVKAVERFASYKELILKDEKIGLLCSSL